MDADVVIVGGGAAGFFAAANLKADWKSGGVVLLEAGNRVMDKVRISGGGRCNVTHHQFDIRRLSEHYPRGGRELRGAFSRFQPRDMIDWLASKGVATKVEADGRVFPVSDDSGTIIHCLRNEAEKQGVRVMLQRRVKFLRVEPEGFEISCNREETIKCRYLLLATGGHVFGYQLAESLGHNVIPPVPSLFTFNIKDTRLADLAGISFPNVSLRIDCGKRIPEQQGGLLITHWGLSGPAVLRSSAWAARELHANHYQGNLIINFAPDEKEDQLREKLQRLLSEQPGKELRGLQLPWFPRRYWRQLVEHLLREDIRCAEISKKNLNLLIDQIRRAEFRFSGKSTNKDEFVTAGGVSLREIDFGTMESRICPGLYFAGEILDIDGITGGFNFQNAWTTAFICAQDVNFRSSS